MNQSHTPHILHIFPSFEVGGAQALTCSIINHLGNRFTHTIIAMDGDFSSKYRINQDIKISYYSIIKEKKKFLAAIWLYAKIIKNIKPDLVFTCNWGSIEWAAANSIFIRIPHVHSEHGFGADEADIQKKRRIIFRRLILSMCKAVIVPSRTLEKIAKDLWKIKPEKIHIIANGIDITENKYLGNDRHSLSSEKAIIIGTIGSLSKVKNHMRLLKIIQKLPRNLNIKVVIIGDGPEKNTLQDFITQNSLADIVELKGMVTKINEAIDSFDIFCLTSDSEQMPLVILEAMAGGCPIISTDTGDIKEMVCQENRQYIIDKNNDDLFVEKMVQLINDAKLRNDLGEKNKICCKNAFSLKKMCYRYENLFLESIGLSPSK